jgi:hypothetical protein
MDFRKCISIMKGFDKKQRPNFEDVERNEKDGEI